jgi:hypothetical protein
MLRAKTIRRLRVRRAMDWRPVGVVRVSARGIARGAGVSRLSFMQNPSQTPGEPPMNPGESLPEAHRESAPWQAAALT